MDLVIEGLAAFFTFNIPTFTFQTFILHYKLSGLKPGAEDIRKQCTSEERAWSKGTITCIQADRKSASHTKHFNFQCQCAHENTFTVNQE